MLSQTLEEQTNGIMPVLSLYIAEHTPLPDRIESACFILKHCNYLYQLNWLAG